MSKYQPIAAGRCLFHIESLIDKPSRGYAPSAGMRVMQPSSGGDDCHFAPASDVYLFIGIDDAQRLSAYFSSIARKLQGFDE